MSLQERIELLVKLGDYLDTPNEKLEAVIHQTYLHNRWFTKENVELALQAVRQEFFDREKLVNWSAQYDIPSTNMPKKIGLIMAGNIPMVGFQDILNTFVAGHQSLIKLSEKDKHLIPHIISVMQDIAPKSAVYFETITRLKDFDGIIATGSNNSARYFEAYFGKYPHIIRKLMYFVFLVWAVAMSLNCMRRRTTILFGFWRFGSVLNTSFITINIKIILTIIFH